MTRIDGRNENQLCPVKMTVGFVDLAEGINDMQPFDAKEYVETLI